MRGEVSRTARQFSETSWGPYSQLNLTLLIQREHQIPQVKGSVVLDYTHVPLEASFTFRLSPGLLE